jgi:hypothetical protein
LTSTRLTAQSALQAFREQGYSDEELPSPSTMAEVLNRMGYRLRKVLKDNALRWWKLKPPLALIDWVGANRLVGSFRCPAYLALLESR